MDGINCHLLLFYNSVILHFKRYIESGVEAGYYVLFSESDPVLLALIHSNKDNFKDLYLTQQTVRPLSLFFSFSSVKSHF